MDKYFSTLVACPSSWEMVSRPTNPPSNVLIRVRIALAGLCRTDIQAMTGQREVVRGRVLGHEGAGWIESIPLEMAQSAQRAGLAEGDRVAFFPFLPCGHCLACRAGEALGSCLAPSALGLDEDGVFGSYVDLPLSVIFKAPSGLSWEALAYAEPVAAAISVLSVPEALTSARVAVLGSGRIAELTARLLDAWVPDRPVFRIDATQSCDSGSMDVVVETVPTEDALAHAAECLRPGGTLIVKSRPATAVPWPHQTFVLRRLRAVGVSYGSFSEGLAAMASGRLNTDGLFGPRFPWTLAGVNAALVCEQQEDLSRKLFFDIGYPNNKD